MKKFRKKGPISLRHLIGNLLTQRRIIPILAVAAGLLPASSAYGTVLDFTDLNPPVEGPGYGGSGTINGAVYTTANTRPAGTGVFNPFLTYQAKGVEEGLNTSQGGNGPGFLNDKRVPQWNHDLTVGALAVITREGVNYYGFELDANETGNGNANRILSIDDIRIWTSPTDTVAGVKNSAELLTKIATDQLGTLRYAQNATFGTTGNWALIDASKKEGGSTSGSGSSDLLVLVPTALFEGAASTDLLYSYTINGVHDAALDGSSVNGSSSRLDSKSGAP